MSTPSQPAPHCELCGEPMPEGETMFKYHGYSGPCPKPPLTQFAPKAAKIIEGSRNYWKGRAEKAERELAIAYQTKPEPVGAMPQTAREEAGYWQSRFVTACRELRDALNAKEEAESQTLVLKQQLADALGERNFWRNETARAEAEGADSSQAEPQHECNCHNAVCAKCGCTWLPISKEDVNAPRS